MMRRFVAVVALAVLGACNSDHKADCEVLAKTPDPSADSTLWYRFEKDRKRDVAWCEDKKRGLEKFLTALRETEGQLKVDKNRAWAQGAIKHVERRVELVTTLCTSFKSPYKPPPSDPNARFAVKTEGPHFLDREYEMLEDLARHNGKMGYVVPEIAMMSANCPGL